MDENISTLKSEKIFYRIRQVDLDGKFEYSQVVEFNMTQQFFELTFTVSPSNSGEAITLNTSRPVEVQSSVKILSLDGKTIYSDKIVRGDKELEITTEGWTPGTYIIHLLEDMQQVAKKIQIQ